MVVSAREPIQRVELLDGRVRYRVRVYAGFGPDGSRRRVMTTYRTLREARDAVSRSRVQVGSVPGVARNTITVEAYLNRWLAGKWNLRPASRATYPQQLAPGYRRLGRVQLQRLTRSQVDDLVGDQLASGGPRGTGSAPGTVRLMLVIFQQAGRRGAGRAGSVERVPGSGPAEGGKVGARTGLNPGPGPLVPRGGLRASP
jgi:hypothetical protein